MRRNNLSVDIEYKSGYIQMMRFPVDICNLFCPVLDCVNFSITMIFFGNMKSPWVQTDVGAFFVKLHCAEVHLRTKPQFSRKNNNSVNHGSWQRLSKVQHGKRVREAREKRPTHPQPSVPPAPAAGIWHDPSYPPTLSKISQNLQDTWCWLSALETPSAFFPHLIRPCPPNINRFCLSGTSFSRACAELKTQNLRGGAEGKHARPCVYTGFSCHILQKRLCPSTAQCFSLEIGEMQEASASKDNRDLQHPLLIFDLKCAQSKRAFAYIQENTACFF